MCKANTEHDTSLCSLNHEGSSKGMEAMGAFKNLMHIFENHSAYVQTLVTDDDSSTKNILKQSYKAQEAEAKEKGLMYVWPRKDGIRIKDTGLLPLGHPNPVFTADVNHRLRGKSRLEYSLAKKSQAKSSCTHTDADRLKRNTSLSVHSNRYSCETVQEFQDEFTCVLEHHFGNHARCKEWCPFIKNEHDKEKQAKLIYRNKTSEENIKLYNQLKEITNKYAQEKVISEIFHSWDTNINESVNHFITKFVRKDSFLCGSICAKARIYVAVSIFNDGYVHYYSKLFTKLGMQYYNTTIHKQHIHLDLLREYKFKYNQKQEVKRRAAAIKAIAIHQELIKEFNDKKRKILQERSCWSQVK